MKEKIQNFFKLIIKLFFISFIAWTIWVVAKDQESQKWAALVGEYQEKIPGPIEKNPIKIIKEVCEENGCDWTLCIRVAAEESQFKPYERFINTDKTIDRGIFMFNSYHYKWVEDDCAYDVRCATKTFCEEVKAGNLRNWVAAKNLGLVK